MTESKKDFNLTRRRFMAVGSAAIAAPFVIKNAGAVPAVEASEKNGMKSIKPAEDVEISYHDINTYEKYYAYYVFGGIRRKDTSRNA